MDFARRRRTLTRRERARRTCTGLGSTAGAHAIGRLTGSGRDEPALQRRPSAYRRPRFRGRDRCSRRALVAVALLSRKDSSMPPPTPTPVVDLTGIPQQGMVLGIPNAKVTLIEYADPAVPRLPCLHRELLPDARRRLRPARQGRDGIPWISLHRGRLREGYTVLLAAAEQNKLWNLQEAMYRNQGRENSGWVTDDLVRRARVRSPGLDVEKLFADAGSERVTQEADGAEAAQAAGSRARRRSVKIGAEAPYLRPVRHARAAASGARRRARGVSDRALRGAAGAVALAGAIVAGYLTWVHYDVRALVCVAGGGCETVQQSRTRRSRASRSHSSDSSRTRRRRPRRLGHLDRAPRRRDDRLRRAALQPVPARAYSCSSSTRCAPGASPTTS